MGGASIPFCFASYVAPLTHSLIGPSFASSSLARSVSPVCVCAVLNLNQMEKARRRRVPAFGEWNYNYQHDEPVATAPAAAWYATPEPEACSDVWFRYSPPPRKPAPKNKQASRRRRRPEGDVSPEGARASSDAAAAKIGATRYQVRHVDEDLYQAPPPEPASHRRPRKKWSLWMGCLGLNSCVAS